MYTGNEQLENSKIKKNYNGIKVRLKNNFLKWIIKPVLWKQ